MPWYWQVLDHMLPKWRTISGVYLILTGTADVLALPGICSHNDDQVLTTIADYLNSNHSVIESVIRKTYDKLP